MTMLGPILPVQLLQQSKICRSSVFHPPPYSPDLAPSDFHVFGLLKEVMGGKSFWSDRGAAGGARVAALSAKEFFSRGIHTLPKCWYTCMKCNGDYIEKWNNCVPFVFNKLRNKKYVRFSFYSPTYMKPSLNFMLYICILSIYIHTVKCRCNERQYNEMFRIAKFFPI